MESLNKIKRLPFIIMLIMIIISFANLIGFNISGAVIPLGVVFFFINKTVEKESAKDSGLDIKSIGTDLKNKKIWYWIVLPFIMNAICISISLLFIPEYIKFETARAGSFVPIELSISSIILFFVFALGEEIAWRAFFQKQLNKVMPIIPVLVISSLLFSFGHYKDGNIFVVVYGIFFIFINSLLYGVIFHKTKNAWISALTHFAANMFEVIIFVLINNMM